MLKKLAIITARGGSKRITDKNIKEFLGIPIIAYSIKAAIESALFDEVMVSTNDEEIAAIAKSFGAKVPFMRSDKNADDYATTAEVINEVIYAYSQINENFDIGCCLYPTAPFITASKLLDAMKLFISKSAVSLVPVVNFSFPPQRAFIIDDDKLKYKWEDNAMKRSQDLETLYHDCGQFYIFRVEEFLKQKKLVMDKTIPYLMKDLEVQDIDTLEDWKIAEIKYRLMFEKEN